MKKYLLSLICISGVILGMNPTPTPIAGPVAASMVTILQNKTGNQNIMIEQIAKQGNKLVVAGKINGTLFITRFNADGTYDGTFGIDQSTPGQSFSIDSLETSGNNIKVKGEAIFGGEKRSYELNWDAQGKLKY